MFQIRPFEARTLRWWFANRELIDMQPPYQRQGNAWKQTTRAYLIDSIINGFDIPKFYLADFTYVNGPLNVAKKHYAVIDGRQRLDAIFDFFSDNLRLAADFLFVEDDSLRVGGLTFGELRKDFPAVADRFENFNPSVMSVITDDEAKINNLFIRLNSSVPLTAAEYRNALPGRAPELIRMIAEHPFFATRVRFIDGKTRQHRQLAAKLLLIEFKNEIIDTKRTQLDTMVLEAAAAAQSPERDIELAYGRVTVNLDNMVRVFEPSDSLLKSQGPVLPYYWFVRRVFPDNEIRRFLIFFERNVGMVRGGDIDEQLPPSFNADVKLYDADRRNTNDASSILDRYRILLRYFAIVREREDLLSEPEVGLTSSI